MKIIFGVGGPATELLCGQRNPRACIMKSQNLQPFVNQAVDLFYELLCQNGFVFVDVDVEVILIYIETAHVALVCIQVCRAAAAGVCLHCALRIIRCAQLQWLVMDERMSLNCILSCNFHVFL